LFLYRKKWHGLLSFLYTKEREANAETIEFVTRQDTRTRGAAETETAAIQSEEIFILNQPRVPDQHETGGGKSRGNFIFCPCLLCHSTICPPLPGASFFATDYLVTRLFAPLQIGPMCNDETTQPVRPGSSPPFSSSLSPDTAKSPISMATASPPSSLPSVEFSHQPQASCSPTILARRPCDGQHRHDKCNGEEITTTS
jgi:hypothetical protein